MPRRMFEAGMSRIVRSIRTALRIRVSMSAIGSVIMANRPSSTVAGNARGRERPVASVRRGLMQERVQCSVFGVQSRNEDFLKTEHGKPRLTSCFLHARNQARLARFRKQIRQMPNLR